MTTEFELVGPGDTLQRVALIMAWANTSVVPVGENDHLIGMVTDRGIVIRAVGAGMAPDRLVEEVMTPVVRYCFDDEEVEQAIRKLAQIQVRRLPVVDRQKRLVGMVSLGDLTRAVRSDMVSRVMGAISLPPGSAEQRT